MPADAAPPHTNEPIRLLLADVDGTLVTQDKVLTDRSKAAVHALIDAGIGFTITSGRPPRGMKMIVDALPMTAPIAAFNGGLYVQADGTITDQRSLPADVAAQVVEIIRSHQLGVWLYRGEDWFVLGRDRHGPHVAREEFTVQFPPTLVDSFDGLLNGDTAKIVGVSDDAEAIHRCEQAVLAAFGSSGAVAAEGDATTGGQHHGKDVDPAHPALSGSARVTAALSQPYYLDVTHPEANKGTVVQYLAKLLNIPPHSIATIGDQPNDVLMFKQGGLSIAMGNSPDSVKQAASVVTESNQNEGFAIALERFILSAAAGRAS